MLLGVDISSKFDDFHLNELHSKSFATPLLVVCLCVLPLCTPEEKFIWICAFAKTHERKYIKEKNTDPTKSGISFSHQKSKNSGNFLKCTFLLCVRVCVCVCRWLCISARVKLWIAKTLVLGHQHHHSRHTVSNFQHHFFACHTNKPDNIFYTFHFFINTINFLLSATFSFSLCRFFFIHSFDFWLNLLTVSSIENWGFFR